MMRWTRWWSGSTTRKVNFILDADIEKFFDTVSQDWLDPFRRASHRRQAHRPPDPEMVEGGRPGRRGRDDERQGDGAGIGDLAAAGQHLPALRLRPLGRRWRRREATGDMIIVRYADDIIVGFEHESDARRFLDAMRARLGSLRCRCTRRRPA